MKPPLMWRIARVAVWLGLNLNWVFDPVTAWRRGEPVRLRRVHYRRSEIDKMSRD